MSVQVIPTSSSLYTDLQSFLQQSGAAGGSSGATPEFVVLEIIPAASPPLASAQTTANSSGASAASTSTLNSSTTLTSTSSDSSGLAPSGSAVGASDSSAASNSGSQFSSNTLQALMATQENLSNGIVAGTASGSDSIPPDFLSALDQGATAQSTSNADGSTSTTITYPDGSSVTLTRPTTDNRTSPAASNSANNASTLNTSSTTASPLESLILAQANALSSNVPNPAPWNTPGTNTLSPATADLAAWDIANGINPANDFSMQSRILNDPVTWGAGPDGIPQPNGLSTPAPQALIIALENPGVVYTPGQGVNSYQPGVSSTPLGASLVLQAMEQQQALSNSGTGATPLLNSSTNLSSQLTGVLSSQSGTQLTDRSSWGAQTDIAIMESLLNMVTTGDAGATSQVTQNANGSNTTTISYADGSTLAFTTASPSTSGNTPVTVPTGSGNTGAYQLIEQMIQLQAQLLNASSTPTVSTTA